jgi:hypothetical protein
MNSQEQLRHSNSCAVRAELAKKEMNYWLVKRRNGQLREHPEPFIQKGSHRTTATAKR